jgi:peptidoglycan-associated lipoprotein
MRTIAVSSLLTLLGCAHAKTDTKTEARTTSTAPAPVAVPIAAQKPQSSCARDLDCAQGELCIDGRCVELSQNLSACTNVRVHFDFNLSALPDSEKPGLDRAARCLKADRALSIRVEGNADERGTEEYNLALADKRARVVADYLRALGASQAQLDTLSYGKENPICDAHDETCWSQNRRADLAVASNAPAKKHRRK